MYFSITVPADRAQELEPLRQAAEKVVKDIKGVTGVTAVLTAEKAAGRPNGECYSAARTGAGKCTRGRRTGQSVELSQRRPAAGRHRRQAADGRQPACPASST